MANRLSKIYTRTGDSGTTGLGDGSRVSKFDLRVQAMGEVDELNSVLGMLLVEALHDDVRASLEAIQHDLFDMGGELSMPGYTFMQAGRVAILEQTLDGWNAELSPLKEFILPGGSRAASVCHLARTVCRRAERVMHALHAQSPVTAVNLQYLNRLSDLLFVLCRTLNRHAGLPDVLWNNQHKL